MNIARSEKYFCCMLLFNSVCCGFHQLIERLLAVLIQPGIRAQHLPLRQKSLVLCKVLRTELLSNLIIISRKEYV